MNKVLIFSDSNDPIYMPDTIPFIKNMVTSIPLQFPYIITDKVPTLPTFNINPKILLVYFNEYTESNVEMYKFNISLLINQFELYFNKNIIEWAILIKSLPIKNIFINLIKSNRGMEKIYHDIIEYE